MFAKGAAKVTNKLVESNLISEADFEIYSFGFENGFAVILNIFSTVLIGFVLGMPVGSLLMLAVFIPLRSFAGGIHTSNNIKCLMLSVVAVFLVLVFAREFQGFSSLAMIISGVVCSVIIYVLSPVQDANKPINKEEARVLKRRTFVVLIIEAGLLIVLLWLGFTTGIMVMVCTLLLVCLSVCAGSIKNLVTLKEPANCGLHGDLQTYRLLSHAQS